MGAMSLEKSTLLKSPSWAFLHTILMGNATLVELAFIDAGIALNCAWKLSSVRSTMEFSDVVTNHTREQFDALSEKVAKLSALVQNGSPENSENMKLSLWD
ncbi:hypothetical protein [Methylocystis suflitae]|uniref:hypothetical protein n=1 Tax=Methylocystis suflitae TaxID=2951405 RepID=UPI00210E9F62|nr:hypothetical protein [Methylocystis suflitae]MCQ4189999.1 hypothetical protein [Methylocystis suflitae]